MNQLSCTVSLISIFAATTLSGCILSPDYDVQYFDIGGADCLEGRLLFFSPEPEFTDSYIRQVSEQDEFSVNPNEHTPIDFNQSDPFPIELPVPIHYNDKRIDNVYVGSDGTIGLGAEGAGNGTLLEHFTTDQVSVFPLDASVAGASTRYFVSDDDVVITYMDAEGTQAQCHFMGLSQGACDIALCYPAIGTMSRGGVVGLPKPPYLGRGIAPFDPESFVEGLQQSNLCVDSRPRLKAESPEGPR